MNHRFLTKRGIMAKIVSNGLLVKIPHKGKEKIFDLVKLFNDNPNRVISIVGTINEDGSPNTAPMSLFYTKVEYEKAVIGELRQL